MKSLARSLILLVAVATPVAISAASPKVPGATPPAPTAASAPAASPGSIPVPEVARQAEEVARLVRDFDALLVPGPIIEAVEGRLPDIAARIGAQSEDTSREIEAQSSTTTLDALTAQWQTARGELVGYVSALGKKATTIEEALDRLTGLREEWSRTRSDALASRAPAQVIERVDGVLSAIASSRTRLTAQRAATLVLQDRVAREVARCEAALERIVVARAGSTGRLFERDSPPLWDAELRAQAVTALPERVRSVLATDAAQWRQFARDQRWRILIQVVLFLGLLLLIRAARRRVPLWASSGESTPAVTLMVEGRVSAPLLFALLASVWIYPLPLPRPVGAVVAALALVPALRLMRLLLDPRLRPRLSVLGAFLLADIVRHLASAVPVLEQQVFLLEMLGGLAVTGWQVSRWRRAATVSAALTGSMRVSRATMVAVLLAFATALVVGAAGYMRLALLLGAGVLVNSYLAVVLYTGVRVADGVVAFALRDWPLRSLGMVRHHRHLIERRVHGLLRSLAAVVWVLVALIYFGLWSAAVSAAEGALAATVKRGSVSISLGDVLVFALTVGAAFALSAFIRFVLAEDVYPRLELGRGLPNALSGMLHYALLLAGFLVALAALGVDLTKITIVAGAFGVGIGFGLQNVVNNFVSGAIVLLERKINVGDAVEVGEVAGQVQQLGMRACTVRNWEGAEVIVPNAVLTSEKVTNWTLSDRRRRVDVAVGVAYGTSPDKALDILLSVARTHPRVLAEPEPSVLFRGFGASALQIEMRVWTDRFDLWMQTQSELSVAVYAALREAGIEIPLPQHEVRLRRGPSA